MAVIPSEMVVTITSTCSSVVNGLGKLISTTSNIEAYEGIPRRWGWDPPLESYRRISLQELRRTVEGHKEVPSELSNLPSLGEECTSEIEQLDHLPRPIRTAFTTRELFREAARKGVMLAPFADASVTFRFGD